MKESEIKSYRLSTKTINAINYNLSTAGCKSASEFVEKAIEFYVGYLNYENDAAYLNPTMESTMKAITKSSEDRIARVLYKMAVSQNMMMHLFGASLDYNIEDLDKLRGLCVQEINKTHGKYSLEDATKYQRYKDE